MMLANGFNFWLPIDISAHGAKMDNLIIFLHWFMAVLFVGWGVYFLMVLIRFRSRPGHRANTKEIKAKASKIGEVAVVIIEAILLLAFSIPIWADVRAQRHMPEPTDDVVKMRVIAQQFAWNVHYPGKDGKFGPRAHEFVTSDNLIGLNRDHPDAKDDIVPAQNIMHIPVNRDVLIELRSLDVIHSFALPYLRIKQDAVPGMTIPVWFKAIETTDSVREKMTRDVKTNPEVLPTIRDHVAVEAYSSPDGSIIVDKQGRITEDILTALAAAGIGTIKVAPDVPTQIACAQLCGNSHYRMRGMLYVDTDEQFAAWMVEEEKWLGGDDDEEDDWDDE